MSPARRLIIVLVPLALLAAAGSAGGAQDVGTADPSQTITVWVDVPRIFAITNTGVKEEDQRSTLRIAFTDMNGNKRTVAVRGPHPGAQEAWVTYGEQHGLPTRRIPCLADWQGRDPSVVPGHRCKVQEGPWSRTWLVQQVAKRAPDFGGELGANGLTLYVSSWTGDAADTGRPSWAHAYAPATIPSFDLPPLGAQTFTGVPQLLGFMRWSKFSPRGYQGYLKGEHYPLIFGSFTYSGYGVYGPGDRYGAPTTAFGRNVYIDTYNSDYSIYTGWRRIMGVLTQPPNGTFCYELSEKGGSGGKSGISASRMYRLTAIGPGLTPVVQLKIEGVVFPFGAEGYDPKTMKWGTGFSAEQAQALRDQAAMIGPGYRTKPKGKGSTDCGATLRQLPEAFFAPPPA